MLLKEALHALEPGGLVMLLHFVVPRVPPGLERIGTWGITTGPGYRIRCATLCRRPYTLDDHLAGTLDGLSDNQGGQHV